MKKILYILVLLVFSSCIGEIKKPNQPKQSVTPQRPKVKRNSQWDQDVEKIRTWVAEKGFDMTPTSQGIYYKIEKEGVGVAHPMAGTKVTVNYRGTLLDGTEFDSSYDQGQPLTAKLTRLIMGWQFAVPLLKKGGKGKFVIPSTLAYGQNARHKIPANSILVFDIELIDFE